MSQAPLMDHESDASDPAIPEEPTITLTLSDVVLLVCTTALLCVGTVSFLASGIVNRLLP